jgi:hypothetical protein
MCLDFGPLVLIKLVQRVLFELCAMGHASLGTNQFLLKH